MELRLTLKYKFSLCEFLNTCANKVANKLSLLKMKKKQTSSILSLDSPNNKKYLDDWAFKAVPNTEKYN